MRLVGENPTTFPSDYFMLMRGRTLPAWVRPSAVLAYEHDHLLIYSPAHFVDKQDLKTAPKQ